MAGIIVDKERYVIDMSLSGKNAHLSTRLATERLSMTGLTNKLFVHFEFEHDMAVHVNLYQAQKAMLFFSSLNTSLI